MGIADTGSYNTSSLGWFNFIFGSALTRAAVYQPCALKSIVLLARHIESEQMYRGQATPKSPVDQKLS